MGELVGLAIGGLFWPWLFGLFCRALGMQRQRAAITGFLLSVVAAAGVASATGFPPHNVALFALFGFGWTVWLTRPRRETETEEGAPDPDDSEVRDLVNQIEQRKGAPKAKPPPDLSPEAKQRPPAKAPTTTTRCSSCGEANEADAAHCIACGQSLHERHCRACQQVNVAKARFCKRCGAGLGSPP